MVTHCLSRVEPCFKFRWDSQKSPTISQHWTLQFSLNWHKKATYISITVGKRCSHTSAHLSSFSFTTLIRYMLVIPHFRWLYKLKGGEFTKAKVEQRITPHLWSISPVPHCIYLFFHIRMDAYKLCSMKPKGSPTVPHGIPQEASPSSPSTSLQRK